MLRGADDFKNHLVQITQCLGLRRQPLWEQSSALAQQKDSDLLQFFNFCLEFTVVIRSSLSQLPLTSVSISAEGHNCHFYYPKQL